MVSYMLDVILSYKNNKEVIRCAQGVTDLLFANKLRNCCIKFAWLKLSLLTGTLVVLSLIKYSYNIYIIKRFYGV